MWEAAYDETASAIREDLQEAGILCWEAGDFYDPEGPLKDETGALYWQSVTEPHERDGCEYYYWIKFYPSDTAHSPGAVSRLLDLFSRLSRSC